MPAAKLDHGKKRFPIPVNPLVHSALRAIYAGGPKSKWTTDLYRRPLYKYETTGGRVTFFLAPSPDIGSRFQHSIALYYTRTRLGVMYYESLRNAVHNLSVETADVLLILMSKIAELRDPGRDIARISFKDIAQFRGVNLRHGSSQNLYEDFKQEVSRLADMRLTMSWKDYKTGGEITFGKEQPDRLLDILDIEYKGGSKKWTAFRFRCGQALSHFLDPDGLRWIGYYSPALFRLNPYHDAFTKKMGTYWTMVGVVAGKKGTSARATPSTILDFCGEDINWRNPGHTVDIFFKAFDRLQEIGVIADVEITEPPSRTKGYFKEWLEMPITATLSEKLWRIRERAELPTRNIRRTQIHHGNQSASIRKMPRSSQELIENPHLIKKFRTDHYLHQAELARALGVSRQTLSNYERSLRSIPVDKAVKIFQIWQRKVRMR